MAGKKIQGITIKLGADTSALGKALKEVDSESASLNGELKKVNKLLKFDPGNTELLAQKQKILAESIDGTEKKLDALKQAQGEVEKMFKNGDIGEKEYREFQRTLAETEQSLKSYRTQASRMDDEQEKLKKGTKQLSTFLSATGRTLDSFKDVLGIRLTNALKDGTANSDDLTVALNKMGRQALGAETDLDKMRASLDKLDDGSEIEEISSELKKMKTNSDESSESLDKIGKGITSGNLMKAAEIVADAGAKVKSFADNAMQAFKEIDQGHDAFVKATGASGKAAEQMETAYKNIIESIPVDDVKDVGRAIGEVNTQFGFEGDALQDASELMLKFSKITDSDVVASAQNAKQAISAFGMSGDDLQPVLDNVSKVSQDTGVSVDSLFQSVINGAPQLQDMGLSFQQSTELLGNFQQAGVDGNTALASLSKAAVNYASKGKTLSEGLAETQKQILGATNKTDALNAASQVFGTRGAVKMVDAIQRGTLDLGKLGKAAEGSEGTVSKTFDAIGDSGDSFIIASNSMKLAMGELGKSIMEAIGPILDKLVPLVSGLAKWFSGLSGTSKTVIVAIGGIAVVVSALLPVIAVVVASIASLGAKIKLAGGIMSVLSSALSALGTALTSPLAVVIALAVAFALAYTKIKPFRDFINGLVDDIKKFAEKVYDSYIGPALNAVMGAFESALSAITGFWNEYGAKIISAVQNLFAFLSPIIFGALGAIKGIFSAVFGTVVDIVKAAWGLIEGIFSSAFDVIKGILKVFAGIFTGDMKTLVSGVKDIFGGLFGFLESGFKALKKTLGGIVKGIANGIIEPIGGAVNGVIKGVNWILDKVGSDKKFDPWEVPHFAKGAGGIKKDTLGVLNDQKGSVYREMVVPPNGKPFVPAGRDVVLPLKKGTKILPAKQTKDFLSSIPHFAGGIGDFFGDIWEGIKDFTGNVWDYISHPSKIVQIAIDKFTDLAGIVEPWLSVATGAVNSVVGGVVDFIKGIFDTQSNVNYNPTAGVEQWRSLAKKALEMEGQYSEANLERLLYQMQTESGGNPNAINDWDINAINGTPSKGLLQVIDPTFRAYAKPGFDSNIWDPLSNMLASIRYAVSRYGSLASAYRGVGYENGIGNIDLSKLIPSIPTLDVRWFKEGGILTKPAIFNMGNGRTGGAGEAGPEAITPINKLKEYIEDGILKILGDKDINITMNITQTIDGKTAAKQLVRYTKPLIEDMDKFQNRLKGVR